MKEQIKHLKETVLSSIVQNKNLSHYLEIDFCLTILRISHSTMITTEKNSTKLLVFIKSTPKS